MKSLHRGIVFLTALAIALLACSTGDFLIEGDTTVRGNGVILSEERQVGGFDGVVLETIGNLRIEIGEETSLVVTADENLLSSIETDVDGTSLVIDIPGWASLSTSRPIEYLLTVSHLEHVGNSASGSIEVERLEGPDLALWVSGSGSMEVGEVVGDSVDIVLSGSGGLEIAGGSVESQTVTISGSGSYEAPDLACRDAEVMLSGSGSATLRAVGELDAYLTGSGNVRVYGSPSMGSQVVTGSGRVISLDD